MKIAKQEAKMKSILFRIFRRRRKYRPHKQEEQIQFIRHQQNRELNVAIGEYHEW